MENNKRHQSAVTFGRFNLLHIGHINLFLKMAETAENVIIGLSTNRKNLCATSRSKVIERALKPYGFRFQIVKAPQPFEVFDTIKSSKVVTWFGEDQYSLGQAANRKYGWEAQVIERMTSSTAIRSMIDNKDWDLLARVVPASIISSVIELRNAETQYSTR